VDRINSELYLFGISIYITKFLNGVVVYDELFLEWREVRGAGRPAWK
jgi:hypothetical protein